MFRRMSTLGLADENIMPTGVVKHVLIVAYVTRCVNCVRLRRFPADLVRRVSLATDRALCCRQTDGRTDGRTARRNINIIALVLLQLIIAVRRRRLRAGHPH